MPAYGLTETPSSRRAALGRSVAVIPKEVWPVGDSIVEGDNAQTLPGWRYGVWNSAIGGIRFTGARSYAGVGNYLTANPQHEGHPFYYVRQSAGAANLIDVTTTSAGLYKPQIVILAGGTNDIALNGDSAATVATSISSWLDAAWAIRTAADQKLVLCTILKRLDGNDSTVQAANALLPAVVSGKSYAANITLIDMYAAIRRPVVGQGYNDAVHPNDEGYTDMATAMWAGGLSALIG